jgi:hypothetical protein
MSASGTEEIHSGGEREKTETGTESIALLTLTCHQEVHLQLLGCKKVGCYA